MGLLVDGGRPFHYVAVGSGDVAAGGIPCPKARRDAEEQLRQTVRRDPAYVGLYLVPLANASLSGPAAGVDEQTSAGAVLADEYITGQPRTDDLTRHLDVAAGVLALTRLRGSAYAQQHFGPRDRIVHAEHEWPGNSWPSPVLQCTDLVCAVAVRRTANGRVVTSRQVLATCGELRWARPRS